MKEWMVGYKDRFHGHYSLKLCNVDGTPVEDTLENVCLMSAAPDMREALKAFKLKLHFPIDKDTDWSKEIALLEAACNKADNIQAVGEDNE